MFYLDGTYRYWLYNKPVDMRKSFNGLSGIVTNAMSGRLYGGDVFIFVNSSRNMMKLLRKEEGCKRSNPRFFRQQRHALQMPPLPLDTPVGVRIVGTGLHFIATRSETACGR